MIGVASDVYVLTMLRRIEKANLEQQFPIRVQSALHNHPNGDTFMTKHQDECEMKSEKMLRLKKASISCQTLQFHNESDINIYKPFGQ
ncbi:CLUMA_CG005648, isoform A [Clunio marinus]|uniref:CLUMA_CG005648, isoform A n=1 Tax=Clunio marinus TaxID=568069 RepID=A0A1J1HXJ6_9DIPT|nr:CLUMA_CG005648, isoform A [Clunio marinus]